MGMLSVVSAEQTVYIGTSRGFASDVTVTVTLEDGKVVALDVDDSGESYTLAGIHGGNAIVEIFVSGRTAANAILADATAE